jgi:hypothetical protein
MPASAALPRFVKLGFAATLRNPDEPSAAFVNRVVRDAGLDPFLHWAAINDPCLGCVVTDRNGDAGFLHAINDTTYWAWDGKFMRRGDRRNIVAFRWPLPLPITSHPLRQTHGVQSVLHAPLSAERRTFGEPEGDDDDGMTKAKFDLAYRQTVEQYNARKRDQMLADARSDGVSLTSIEHPKGAPVAEDADINSAALVNAEVDVPPEQSNGGQTAPPPFDPPPPQEPASGHA